MTVTALKNVVVVGGSYVGVATAQQLAAVLPVTHRVLLVEPHTHFHHLFAFPRFSVTPGHEHKAFIPYSGIFQQEGILHPGAHAVVHARALRLTHSGVLLDRPWEGATELPYEYVALATGTRLAAPGTMPVDDKRGGAAFLQAYQADVARATDIVITGGGAVGVQMATDIKELYPAKRVTLVQSRNRVMPRYHAHFHELIAGVLAELGVALETGAGRVSPPASGWPRDGSTFDVPLADGRTVPAQLVIEATGQAPNNALAAHIPGLVNPENGFLRVKPSLQLAAPGWPHAFAVGDIADTGAHKAARPGVAQAAVLAQNVRALIDGKQPPATYKVDPAAIHLTLGLKRNIIFRNPGPDQTEPTFRWRDE